MDVDLTAKCLVNKGSYHCFSCFFLLYSWSDNWKHLCFHVLGTMINELKFLDFGTDFLFGNLMCKCKFHAVFFSWCFCCCLSSQDKTFSISSHGCFHFSGSSVESVLLFLWISSIWSLFVWNIKSKQFSIFADWYYLTINIGIYKAAPSYHIYAIYLLF